MMSHTSFIQDGPGFCAAGTPRSTPRQDAPQTPLRYHVPHEEPQGEGRDRGLRQNLGVYLRRVVAGATIRLATALSVGEEPGCLISYDAWPPAGRNVPRLLVLSPGKEG